MKWIVAFVALVSLSAFAEVKAQTVSAREIVQVLLNNPDAISEFRSMTGRFPYVSEVTKTEAKVISVGDDWWTDGYNEKTVIVYTFKADMTYGHDTANHMAVMELTQTTTAGNHEIYRIDSKIKIFKVKL